AHSAEEIARLGDRIYKRKIRKQVERDHHGDVVAIDVNSAEYEIGKDALTACRALLARVPAADIWCVRVGYRTLYHMLRCDFRPKVGSLADSTARKARYGGLERSETLAKAAEWLEEHSLQRRRGLRRGVRISARS